MSRKLPYFCWYASDAISDEKYSRMTLAERGLYHTALNYSWTNDGLPVEMEMIRRTLQVSSVSEFARCWPAVAACFVGVPSDPPRLRNKRQEEERSAALNLSDKRARAGAKGGSKRQANAKQLLKPGLDFAKARAYGSGSVSGFDFESKKENFLADDSIFPEWWQTWSSVRGTHHSREALQAWLSVVPMHLESAALECTVSYLASLDNPAKGFNPHTFLFDQAKEMFQSRWPANELRIVKRETRSQRLARLSDEREGVTG